MYESENYGTPYEDGGMSSKELPGNRYFLEITEDIHHKKGMTCIDCHTRNEIMGDGTMYAHYEDQVEIKCATCHTTGNIGVTRKNEKLNNAEPKADTFVLKNKLTHTITNIAEIFR